MCKLILWYNARVYYMQLTGVYNCHLCSITDIIYFMKIKKNFMDIMKGRGKNKMWERPEKRVSSIKYQGQIEDDVIHSFTHDEFSISLRSIEINLRSISVFLESNSRDFFIINK